MTSFSTMTMVTGKHQHNCRGLYRIHTQGEWGPTRVVCEVERDWDELVP